MRFSAYSNYFCASWSMEWEMSKKITTAEFIERSNRIHNNAYTYDGVVYQGNAVKVKVYCPKHDLHFDTTPNNHKRHGCPECGKQKIGDGLRHGKEVFIARSREIFGDAFDYSKVVYTTARNEVVLTCKSCNKDFKKIADLHVNGKSGCPYCIRKKVTSQTSNDRKEKWIKRVEKKFGDKYDLSRVNYVDQHTHVEIGCDVHGWIMQNPASFANSKTGCSKCYGRNHDKEDALKEFKAFHGNKYKYDMSNYSDYKSGIKILCDKHGWVKINAGYHKRGGECPECGKEINELYKHDNYINHVKNRFNGIANLYVIRCFNGDEEFYKVGITCKRVKDRYPKNRMPYQYEIIKTIEDRVEFIFSLEKQIHNILRTDGKKYRPKITFGGSAKECFSRIPKEIYKLLDSIDKSDQLQLIA